MKIKFKGAVKRSDCAISMALDTVGDRWSLLVLRDLMFSDKRSYGELLASNEKIATNILAARLATLEEHGLIRRGADAADNRRILYFLTEKGIGLLPVIVELMQWMANFDAGASCGMNLKGYKKDRAAMYNEMMKAMRKTHLLKK